MLGDTRVPAGTTVPSPLPQGAPEAPPGLLSHHPILRDIQVPSWITVHLSLPKKHPGPLRDHCPISLFPQGAAPQELSHSPSLRPRASSKDSAVPTGKYTLIFQKSHRIEATERDRSSREEQLRGHSLPVMGSLPGMLEVVLGVQPFSSSRFGVFLQLIQFLKVQDQAKTSGECLSRL